MREVRFVEPYLYRVGSKLAGKKWKEVADNLNALTEFKAAPRDARSVRERYQKVTDIFKAKIRDEESSSGISPPELSELEKVISEIQEKLEDKQDEDMDNSKEVSF